MFVVQKESIHMLKIEDLEEKFRKAKADMDQGKQEYEKIARSIHMVESQLTGEEVSKHKIHSFISLLVACQNTTSYLPNHTHF